MKHIYTLFFIFVSLFFVNCSTGSEPSFRLYGTIESDNSYLILHKTTNILDKSSEIVDTIAVHNGHFDKTIHSDPHFYTLEFDEAKLTLVIDEGQQIEIIQNGDHFDINGSEDTNLYLEYEDFRKESLNVLVNSVRSEIRNLKKVDSINENEIIRLREEEVENYKHHLNELTYFINDRMGTSLAIYGTVLRWNNLGPNLTILKEVVKDFKRAHPNLVMTEQMESKLEVLERTNIGSTILNIEMPDQWDTIKSLYQTESKFTLVDFWASWCPPCRSESGLLNDLYADYNAKGFEIYGVSLDSRRSSWLKAIDTDNRSWTNVSTVQGLNTPVAQELGITALPNNFIIDSEGKIIATNIHGEELKKKIDELFLD